MERSLVLSRTAEEESTNAKNELQQARAFKRRILRADTDVLVEQLPMTIVCGITNAFLKT